jgi:hypothetical protein
MGANNLLGPVEGMGPENVDFFGPKLHSINSVPFQGPKKSDFQGPPFQWPSKWIFLHQNHYVPHTRATFIAKPLNSPVTERQDSS